MVQHVEVLWTLHTSYTHTKYGSGCPFLKYIQGCTAWWLSYKEINDATSNLLPSDQPAPPPPQLEPRKTCSFNGILIHLVWLKCIIVISNHDINIMVMILMTIKLITQKNITLIIYSHVIITNNQPNLFEHIPHPNKTSKNLPIAIRPSGHLRPPGQVIIPRTRKLVPIA